MPDPHLIYIGEPPLPVGVDAPPNAIQLEPVEGCNLRCAFCGIRGIREAGTRDELSGPYKFMTPRTARVMADRLRSAGWHPRLEFAMHGEPTLNAFLPEMIQVISSAAPRSPVLLTTNGIPLLDEWTTRIVELFEAGCNTIAVDNYRPFRCERAVLDTRLQDISVYQYPQDGAIGNPHRRPRRGEYRLILVEDISLATSGTHHHLSNHAGCAAPKDPVYKDRQCALPFRELSIRWDGSVALCCNDWRGTYKVGNIHEMSLHGIWDAPAMNAARRKLYHKQRDFGPCDGCTHLTYRNGLLPDKMGKNTLPEPDAQDASTIRAALSSGTLTPVVLRKWEKGPVAE